MFELGPGDTQKLQVAARFRALWLQHWALGCWRGWANDVRAQRLAVLQQAQAAEADAQVSI